MTEQLPIPLSRADCYLATAAGMTGVILPADGPESREEQYLARMAGDTDQEIPAPLSLKEQWLAIICGDTSVTTPEIKGAFLIGQQMVRVEFLAKAAGIEGIVLPTNPNRTEQYFANIGGIVPDPGVLTQAKGTYIVLNNVLRGIDSLDYIYGDTFQQTYSGKNLYEGSQDFSGTWTNSGEWTTETEKYNGLTVKSRKAAWGGIYKRINVETGKTYTFSVYIKADSSARLDLYVVNIGTATATVNVGQKAIYPTADWQRYSLTFTVTSSGTICARVENTTNQSNSTYICGYQLEESASMTDYEPYVGGISSPNPDYPQDIQVVTGEQTVIVHGKNILPITMQSQTLNGVAYTVNEDKSITMNGKASSRSEPRLYQNVPGAPTVVLKAGVTYHNSTSTILYWYSNNYHTVVPGGNYTPVADEIIQFAFVRVENGETVDTTIYPQLEQGSTATSYEPYQSQDYKVNLASKNLLDPNNMKDGYIANNGATEVGATTGDMVTPYFIPIEPNSSVTMTIFETTSTYAPWFGMCEYSDSNESSFIIRQVNQTAGITSATFTVGANTHYIRVSARNLHDATKYQLEYGSSTTSYEKYRAPLCKIGTYQDYIYKSGGDWYVHKEISHYSISDNMLGSITETYSNVNYASFMKPLDYVSYDSFDYTSLYCTHALFRNSPTGGWNSTNAIGGGFAAANRYSFWIGFTKSTTYANMKSILSGTTIYYPLATPTDTKITDATLISELEAVDSAVLPTPDAFIQVTGNLAGEIEISYYAKSEE